MPIHSPEETSHLKAVLQAFLVTFWWSTSWVVIKLGLKDIPALTVNSLSSILGRYINRSRIPSPLLVTLVSIGIGSALLLRSGILVQLKRSRPM